MSFFFEFAIYLKYHFYSNSLFHYPLSPFHILVLTPTYFHIDSILKCTYLGLMALPIHVETSHNIQTELTRFNILAVGKVSHIIKFRCLCL